MADIIYKQRAYNIALDWGTGGGREVYSRNAVYSSESPPDKAVGQWIVFPDGSKFRKATTYARSRSYLKSGSSQNTRGINTFGPWYGNTAYVETGPGGWTPDDFFIYYDFEALKSLDVSNLNRPPFVSTLPRNEAVTKSLLKLADQKANMGENLATLSQTMHLFTNPVGSLVKQLKKFRNHKDLGKFFNQSYRDLVRGGVDKRISEEYLKYVYGWKPLMEDIYGLCELAKQKGKTPLLLHSRHTAHRDAYQRSYTNFNTGGRTYSTLENVKGPDKVTCNIWARIDPDGANIRTLNQLGLVNPLSLVWELVPWSFVVDWVLPIGSMLQALSAPAGLIFVDGSISRKLSVSGTYTNRHAIDSSWITFSWTTDISASGTFVYEGYTRETLSSWPLPGLWYDPDPLRGDRIFKALALSVLSLRSIR